MMTISILYIIASMLSNAFLFLLCFTSLMTIKSKCFNEKRNYKYYKIRSCYKSNLRVIRTKEVANVTECARYANKHNGLAFNFISEDGVKYRKFYTRNCHVLGCPELSNSSTFIEDLAFDYYSAFGNWNATENSICIESTGLFSILADPLNYTDSALGCQEINAELADVVTEIRTKHLSQYIESTLDGWYKVAYVGLDDIDQEGTFLTALGNSLSFCSRYRAWAPGHPLKDDPRQDCVVLDGSRMWRTVDCRRRFPALCELYPERPKDDILPFLDDVDCGSIKNHDELYAEQLLKKYYDLHESGYVRGLGWVQGHTEEPDNLVYTQLSTAGANVAKRRLTVEYEENTRSVAVSNGFERALTIDYEILQEIKNLKIQRPE